MRTPVELTRALPPNSPAHTALPRSTGDKAGLTEPVVMLFMPLRITEVYHGEEKTKTIAAQDIDPTKNFVLDKKCSVIPEGFRNRQNLF